MKAISIAGLALALFSLAPVAGAQTTIPYMTVEDVALGRYSIVVTGVVQGETTTSVRTFQPVGTIDTAALMQLDRCHRSMLLALSKPGQYVARISSETCAIALVTP